MGCPKPYQATLLTSLAEAVPRFRAAFDGLGPAELDAHPIAGKWSMREFATHVAQADLGWTRMFAGSVCAAHPELGELHPAGWLESADALARSGLNGALSTQADNHEAVIRWLGRLPEDRFDHPYPPVSWMIAAKLTFVIKESVNWGLVIHLDHHLRFMHRTRVALGRPIEWMAAERWAPDEPPPG